MAALVVDLAEPAPDDRLVDLGAGTGLLTLALAPLLREVVAVDSSPLMLERLGHHAVEGHVSNVRTVVADMRSVPLPDESASLVVSNYAFHHLQDRDKELALSEARRVLEPGGRLVVCDMMFALSLRPRDRQLIARKLATLARRGPSGVARVLANASRVAAGRWERPSPPETWRRMLEDRHFESIAVMTLEHEGGIAVGRRPARGNR